MGRLLILAAVGLALVAALASGPAPRAAEVQLVAGTLAMSNSRDGAAILEAAGMAPGDSRVGDVTIANTGSLTGTFGLSQSVSDTPGPAGGALSSALDLLVQDMTNLGSPATIYTGKLGSMGARALGDVAPGTARTYRFTLSLPDGGDNAYQGSAVSVRYDWTATADEPAVPPPPPPPPPVPPPVPVPPAVTPGAPAAQLALTGQKRQRLLRQRGLFVLARCSQACSVRAAGRGAGAAKRVKLSGWSGRVTSGRQVKIKLRLSKKALKTAKKALRRHRRATMSVTVRATFGAGASITRRLKVSLR